MMHKILLGVAILGLSSSLALAQEFDFSAADTDSSGELSFTEAQVAWPDVTQEAFDAADTDTSGGLSAEEVAAMVMPAGSTNETTEPTDATGTGTTDSGNGEVNSDTQAPATGAEVPDEGAPAGATTTP
jgi:hypothetical protein